MIIIPLQLFWEVCICEGGLEEETSYLSGLLWHFTKTADPVLV